MLKNMMRYHYPEQIKEKTMIYHVFYMRFLIISILGCIVYTTSHSSFIYYCYNMELVFTSAVAMLVPCVIIFLFLRYKEALQQSLMASEYTYPTKFLKKQKNIR